MSKKQIFPSVLWVYQEKTTDEEETLWIGETDLDALDHDTLVARYVLETVGRVQKGKTCFSPMRQK